MSKSRDVKTTKLLDTLFNDALDRMFPSRGDGPSLAQSLSMLTPAQKIAYLYRILYTQILRNGFQFWIHNGFLDDHNIHVLEMLDTVGTDDALEVQEMLRALPEIATRARSLEAEYDNSDPDAEEDEAIDAALRTLHKPVRTWIAASRPSTSS